ncbi:hypothetical protein LXL04_023474 [Taraxacum kok-saghyz]
MFQLMSGEALHQRYSSFADCYRREPPPPTLLFPATSRQFHLVPVRYTAPSFLLVRSTATAHLGTFAGRCWKSLPAASSPSLSRRISANRVESSFRQLSGDLLVCRQSTIVSYFPDVVALWLLLIFRSSFQVSSLTVVIVFIIARLVHERLRSLSLLFALFTYPRRNSIREVRGSRPIPGLVTSAAYTTSFALLFVVQVLIRSLLHITC